MRTVPLRHVAEVRSSSVDKKSHAGELPVRLCNYMDVYRNDRVSPAMDLMAATASPEEIARFRLAPGDSVITKDSEDPTDIGVSAFVDSTADDFICAYHLAIVRPLPGVIPRYLNWAIRGREVLGHWTNQASGMTRYGLALDGIKSAPIHVPDADSQRRIADFLDDQVARVDRIVAARRRQMTAIEETRLSWLDELIRDAGPPQRLARLLQLRAVGVVVNPSTYFREAGVPFIHGYNVRDGYFDLTDLKLMSEEDSLTLGRSRLQANDVLVVRAGYPGRAAVVPHELAGGNCASVLLLRPGSRLASHWLAAFFNSPIGKHHVRSVQYGAAQGVINLSDVESFPIPLPSMHEQERRLAELRRMDRELTSARGLVERQVGELGHLKQSIISAAVTGELDVTTAGSGIPG